MKMNGQSQGEYERHTVFRFDAKGRQSLREGDLIDIGTGILRDMSL
jgi:hypothetical protein